MQERQPLTYGPEFGCGPNAAALRVLLDKRAEAKRMISSRKRPGCWLLEVHERTERTVRSLAARIIGAGLQ